MDFDKTNKVIIETMDEVEAKAFVKFLGSEVARHLMDIENAYELIDKVKQKFNLHGKVE